MLSHTYDGFILLSVFSKQRVYTKTEAVSKHLHKREHAHLMKVTTFGSAKVSRVFYVILGMHAMFFFRDNNFTFLYLQKNFPDDIFFFLFFLFFFVLSRCVLSPAA